MSEFGAADLFFAFRYAKRLLEIDHPKCHFCDEPSVGCHVAISSGLQLVLGRCETHWADVAGASSGLWRVRWDEMEDAARLSAGVAQPEATP